MSKPVSRYAITFIEYTDGRRGTTRSGCRLVALLRLDGSTLSGIPRQNGRLEASGISGRFLSAWVAVFTDASPWADVAVVLSAEAFELEVQVSED
jgi:hypothetical protein